MKHKTEKFELCRGDWLKLEKIIYSDNQGRDREWESCARLKCSGAVLIIAMMKPSNRLILIRQFRPPVNAYAIEFPAGLLDHGEKYEETAIRELKEECGYNGKVISISGPYFSSPGLSSESVAFAMMEIDELSGDKFVGTEFDESEDIETFLVPLKELNDFLRQREKLGDKIDAKLSAIAFFIEHLFPLMYSENT